MHGYWTKLRFPFQTKGGGWADIDVLAYHPEEKILIISESKVRGPKKDIYAYTKYTQEKYGTIFDYDEDSYLSFMKYIKLICSDGILFENFKKMVKTLIIQLVSNYYIDDSVLPKVKKDVFNKIRKSIPKNIRYEIRLDTTFQIICEIIKLENSLIQGRRYGHPVIDIAREINRYIHPNIKYAGRRKKAIDAIKDQLKTIFSKALE